MANRAKDRRSGGVQDLPPQLESSPSLASLRLGSEPARSGAASRTPWGATRARPQSRVRQTKPIGPVAESFGDESHPTTVETKPIVSRVLCRTPPGTSLTSVRGAIVSNEANLGPCEALADVNCCPGQHLGTEPASHAPVKTRPIMTDVPRRTLRGTLRHVSGPSVPNEANWPGGGRTVGQAPPYKMMSLYKRSQLPAGPRVGRRQE